tara:strand:- start:2239 stop:3588 length:1350 start_codon:yes stop_codon:yes gene_type:complete
MRTKIPDKAKDDLIKKWVSGATYTELAKFLHQYYGVDVHRTTVMRWVTKEIPIDLTDPSDIELDSLEDRYKLDSRLARYRAEALAYRRLYNIAIQKTLRKDKFIDAIYDATTSFQAVKPIKPTKPTGKRRGESTQTVVAPLTDTHIGEDVDYQQMAGLNSYSFEIFNRRLSGWAKQVLNLVELRRASVPIDDLIVPMLGDMISGDIHDELIKTNQDNVLGQMSRGANLIAQALLYLAPHFKTITVPCVVGNHGRMTRKPPMKDKYMDWDYMLYQWVAAFCKNQKNIKFQINTSYMNIFQVYDKNVLIMHGDSASGAGSIATITKVLTNLRSVLQFRQGLEPEVADSNSHIKEPNLLPTSFDSVMMGHFHRVDEIDIGTGHAIICGCMKGGDEFALQRLAVITKPQQIVTYWHPKYGYIGKETIYLNAFDTVPSQFTDVLAEVWSESPSF